VAQGLAGVPFAVADLLNLEVDLLSFDPHDEDLAAQLGSIRWKLTSRGRIQIESKDEMRQRGLPSPDQAAALATPSPTPPCPRSTSIPTRARASPAT